MCVLCPCLPLPSVIVDFKGSNGRWGVSFRALYPHDRALVLPCRSCHGPSRWLSVLDTSPPPPSKPDWIDKIRYRKLPDITSKDRSKVSHGSRAAINTPIQGGAADVAMVAMIGIVRSPVLKKLGWKLLLQVASTAVVLICCGADALPWRTCGC